VCYSRPWCTLMCQILSRVYSVALCWRKPPFCGFFGLRHLVVSQIIGSSLRKLDMHTQLQTFPYPTVSKSFLYSNAFMAKSGAQTDVQKRDEQTEKTQRFWPPRPRVKCEHYQTWHGDRGPRARSCISKTFGV